MPNRSRLHELVDTLPEGALAVAQGTLEHFQQWPPAPPPQLADFKERMNERMRKSRPSGMGGGGSIGGGGSFQLGPGGRREHGHQAYSNWEGDTVVVTTHRFHAGHELVIEERLRFDAEANRLVYSHQVSGPGDVSDKREIEFTVRP